MLALLQQSLPQVLDLAVVTAALGGATFVLVRQVAGAGGRKKGCSSGCGSCPSAAGPAPKLVQIGRPRPPRK